MAIRVQNRRGPEARWLEVDPILLDGEIAFVKDKNYIKIGDGAKTFSQLDKISGGSETSSGGGSVDIVTEFSETPLDTKVPSEKLVKDALNNLSSEVSKVTDVEVFKRNWVKEGGVYNEETEFYELNGLLDITYEEAIRIYDFSKSGTIVWANSGNIGRLCRTNFWGFKPITPTTGYYTGLFAERSNAATLEVIKWGIQLGISDTGTNFFHQCQKLHTILGVFELTNGFTSQCFYKCYKLANIDRLKFRVAGTYDLSELRVLSTKSVQSLTDGAFNDYVCTAILYPEVYDRVIVDPTVIANLEENPNITLERKA